MLRPSNPPAHTARRRLRVALTATLFGLASAALVAHGADAVIWPDGFVVQGRWFKETELVMDVPGRPVRVAKANGFDVVQDGPKWVVFSSHAQKGGKVEKDIVRPEYVAYTRKLTGRGNQQLPPADKIDAGPFDDKWKRTVVFHHPNGGGLFNRIDQIITSLDPYTLKIQSNTFYMTALYHTAEWDPKDVRRLLGTHPDLTDTDGKPAPLRRMAIATFLKDVGWIGVARQEMDRLKTDAPPPWDKETTERFDQTTADIDRAETKLFIDELEAAVGSGRYDTAAKAVAAFTPKASDAQETTRLAVVKAQIETVRPRYERAARLLRELIEQENGTATYQAHAAAGGPAAGIYAPRKKVAPQAAALLAAASTVLAELHPDTTSRLDLFIGAADGEAKRRAEGKSTTTQPAELLALAITGWLKGKNGAEPNPAEALRYWNGRQVALGYLREEIANNRRAALDNYLQAGKPLGADELAQVITLLPPPFPENLDKPEGKPVSVEDAGVPGAYLRNSGPIFGSPAGYDYVLRLPPEYHHGRSYPVLIALTTPQISAEKMTGLLAEYAARHGYILVAPVWTNRFNQNGYEFTGKEHPWVTAPLRDLLRRFQVDPDKVFLFGFGEGANFALDVGMAHPDLFAGLVAMGANPPMKIFIDYWKNCQKLPTYFVAGELSGTFVNLRKLYEKWTVNGFPALLTIYKGRGTDWYRMELPRIFDWMGRKTRARGTASLRLNQAGVEPWQVLRETDDRFYWVGVGAGGLRNGNMVANWETAPAVVPAQFRADIRNGVIAIDRAIGVRKFVVWLERDLIDWSKPVRVTINDRPPLGYRPKVLQPDLNLMFEELFRTGDRKMLFLGKLEVDGPG